MPDVEDGIAGRVEADVHVCIDESGQHHLVERRNHGGVGVFDGVASADGENAPLVEQDVDVLPWRCTRAVDQAARLDQVPHHPIPVIRIDR